MSAQLDRIQASLATAKMSGGGDFIKPGTGVMAVKSIEVGTNRSNERNGFFKAVLQIVSSTQTDPDVKPDPPGATVDFLQLYDQFPDTAGARTAEFLTALTGDSQEACTAALPTLVGPDQPMRGALIAYRTRTQITKKTQRKLTLPMWETVKQTTQEIAARKAALDAGTSVK